MSAELRICLFGGLQISLAGSQLASFVSHKAPALLAYLAVTRRTHQRDTLAALLWGELPDQGAHNNLRQVLSSLRRQLDPFLAITRDTAGIRPDAAVSVDVEDFDRGLRSRANDHSPEARIQQWQAAAALVQGDFMAGFSVRDAPEFEDWMLGQRSRYRELALNCFHTLAQLQIQTGRTAEAIDAATRMLELDPWREEGRRLLMLALARSGQRSAAMAQFETCRRVLEKELGVEPSADTIDLARRIRAARRIVALPPAATPFVGRAEELTSIANLLFDPTCRLITLSGPGGAGKTRLAQEAAARAADRFLHGVCFVSLAPAASVDVAPSAIADAVGLTLTGAASPRDQVIAHLRDKELLLVLDNLEHLPGADDLAARLEQACPEVRLLATSRQRLNLHGERLLELEGLDLPPDAPGETANLSSAAQLFINTARHAWPAFAPDAGAQLDIDRICRLVHGLPLALELAAGWVREMDCSTIAAELERGLTLLATTHKNVPARHRSLQATFDHSWGLLSDAERAALAHLSVFRGGWDAQAAESVANSPASLLASLCEKSLLRREQGGRYAIHELLRQYAEARLRAEPQSVALVQARHGEHYLGLLAELEDALNDARQNRARAVLAAEIHNIRAAWHWAAVNPRLDLLQRALDGLRFAFDYAGWYVESFALLDAAANAERAAGAGAGLGRLLARQAWLYSRTDQFEIARRLVHESLDLLRRAPEPLPADEALCKQCLGYMSRAVGAFEDSVEQCRESVELYRAAGNPRSIAIALNGLGVAHNECGRLGEGRRLLAECLDIRRELGDQRGIGVALVNLGYVALAQRDDAGARDFAEEALQLFRAAKYPTGIAVALNNRGAALINLGEYDAALAPLNECLAICDEHGHRHVAAHALANLARATGDLGELAEAWRLDGEALSMAQAIGSTPANIYALVVAAFLVAHQGDDAHAAALASYALGQPAANHDSRNRSQDILADLAARMPPEALTAARDRYASSDLRQVTAEVLAAARQAGALAVD